jgi:hypothetical protein
MSRKLRFKLPVACAAAKWRREPVRSAQRSIVNLAFF